MLYPAPGSSARLRPGPDASTLMVIDVLSSLAFNTVERKKSERSSWATAEEVGRRYRRDKKKHNYGREEKESERRRE